MSTTSQHRHRGPRSPNARHPEFVVVRTTHGIYHVSRFEGARIADTLARWWVPRWIEFTDLHESIVRIRSCNVLVVFDTSHRIRFSERALSLMLDREEERHGRLLPPMLDADTNFTEEE
jgi:hypothetical protein